MAWTQLAVFSSSYTAQDIAYGSGLWVAVATSGQLKTSPDGTTWTAKTSGFGTTTIRCVERCNTLWMTGGDSGKLATSSDGATWTLRTGALGTVRYTGFAYGNGVYIAVSSYGAASSTNGTSWSAITSLSTEGFTGVAYGGGVFVAITGSGSSGAVYTSIDGASWTLRSTTFSAIYAVHYANGLFTIVGDNGKSASSSDGASWSYHSTGISGYVLDVTYGAGRWLVIGGANVVKFSSDDGTTWNTDSHALTFSFSKCGYGNSLFIIVGANGAIGYAPSNSPVQVTPAQGSIVVQGQLVDRGLRATPSTGSIGLIGLIPSLSSPKAFHHHRDMYEMSALFQWYTVDWVENGLTLNSQIVYDYDDGSNTRDTVTRLWGGTTREITDETKKSDGFITVDNFGSVSFTDDGLILGVASNIQCVEPPSYTITNIPGTYGSVGYDVYVPYYLDFIASIVGEATPHRAYQTVVLPTPLRTTPDTPLAYPVVQYDAAIGTYILVSGSTSSRVYVSLDYGYTWIRLYLPFTYNPENNDYAYCNTIFKHDSRWIVTGARSIWTSDDGVNWTQRLYVAANVEPSGSIIRHPITGVIATGGLAGRIYYSADDGITWSAVTFGSEPLVDLYFHQKSLTFISVGEFIHTSTNGINWVKRSALPTTSITFSGDYIFVAGYYSGDDRVSTNSGAIWSSSSDFGDIFEYVDGRYFTADTITSSMQLSYSSDGATWYVPPSIRYFLYTLKTNINHLVYGNGLLVALCDSGILLISEDKGMSWRSYDQLVSDTRVYDKFIYSPTSGVWLTSGTYGYLSYAKDPRLEWTTIRLYDYSGYGLDRFRKITDTGNSLIVQGSTDVFMIPIIPPEPVYAQKPIPYALSGLIGFTCSAGQASGTVLSTGFHILTVAHAVYGVTTGDYGSFEFVFNTPEGVVIEQPVVSSITIHPAYSNTSGTSGWINYDIAIITLESPVDYRVSRYELFTGSETLPSIFSKTAYGHGWDAVNGISEADALHFITFQNRYEAYGQDLAIHGYTYILDGYHLLYDYDNGLTAQDAIGTLFPNQPENTGVANEGFTAPGRSGSAGIVDGKIYGVTWGNVSLDPFDVAPSNQGTYGEIGIDLRASAFASWVSVAADFGLDFVGALPGFSQSSELWFTAPAGALIEGELPMLAVTILAAEPDQFNIEHQLPGLESTITVALPWQTEGILPELSADILLALAPDIVVAVDLPGLESSMVLEAITEISVDAKLAAFTNDIVFAKASLFDLDSLLTLALDVGFLPAYDASLNALLPTLMGELAMHSDFYLGGILPGLTGELAAESWSIDFTGKLPELAGALQLNHYAMTISAELPRLDSDIVLTRTDFASDTLLPALRSTLVLDSTGTIAFEGVLPTFGFEGLWRNLEIDAIIPGFMLEGLSGGVEIEGAVPGLRGSFKIGDANRCTTGYL